MASFLIGPALRGLLGNQLKRTYQDLLAPEKKKTRKVKDVAEKHAKPVKAQQQQQSQVHIHPTVYKEDPFLTEFLKNALSNREVTRRGTFYNVFENMRTDIQKVIGRGPTKRWGALGRLTVEQLDREARKITPTGVAAVDINFATIQRQIGIISNNYRKGDERHLDLERVLTERISAVAEVQIRHQQRAGAIMDARFNNMRTTMMVYGSRLLEHDRHIKRMRTEIDFLRGRLSDMNYEGGKEIAPNTKVVKEQKDSGSSALGIVAALGLAGTLGAVMLNRKINEAIAAVEKKVGEYYESVKKKVEDAYNAAVETVTERHKINKQENEAMTRAIQENERNPNITEEERTKNRTRIVRETFQKKYNKQGVLSELLFGKNKDAEKVEAPQPTTPENKTAENKGSEREASVNVTEDIILEAKKDITLKASRTIYLEADRIDMNSSRIFMNGIEVTPRNKSDSQTNDAPTRVGGSPPVSDPRETAPQPPPPTPQDKSGAVDDLMTQKYAGYRGAVKGFTKRLPGYGSDNIEEPGSATAPGSVAKTDDGGFNWLNPFTWGRPTATRTTPGTMNDAAPVGVPTQVGADYSSVLAGGNGRALRKAHGWAGTDPVWQSLNPYEKAAVMSLMEADSNNVNDAINAAGAMVNRASKHGEDLGAHVSGAIYQPTMEWKQRVRLEKILKSQNFKYMTQWVERRTKGLEADPVNGATHFLAHEKTMLALERKNPKKYRSWRKWSKYNSRTGEYEGVLKRDKSHAFVAPEGRFVPDTRRFPPPPEAGRGQGQDQIGELIRRQNREMQHDEIGALIQRQNKAQERDQIGDLIRREGIDRPDGGSRHSPFDFGAGKMVGKDPQVTKENAPGVVANAAVDPSIRGATVDRALRMMGMNERQDRQSIMQYLRKGGSGMDPSRTAWCAEFVNSSLAQAGIRGTQNSRSRSVATSFSRWGYGVKAQEAAKGDVLVEHRGRTPGRTGGHVGMATGNSRIKNGRLQLEMLGGNQGNAVTKKWVDASRLHVRRAGENELISTQHPVRAKGPPQKPAIPSLKRGAEGIPGMEGTPSGSSSKPFQVSKLEGKGAEGVAGAVGSPSGPATRVNKEPQAPNLEPQPAESSGPNREGTDRSSAAEHQAGEGGDRPDDSSSDPALSYPTQEAGDSAPPQPGDNGSGDYKHCLI